MHLMFRFVLLAFGLLLVGAGPASAQALQTRSGSVTEAADQLRGGDRVYVAPDARPTIDAGTAEQLREQSRRSSIPVYIAVLSPEIRASGQTEAAARQLAASVGRRGVYAVVSGNNFQAGSVAGALPPRRAPQLRNLAVREAGAGGLGAILQNFVARVDTASGGSGGLPSPGSGPVGRDDSGGSGFGLLAALLAGGGAFFALRRRRQRKEERALLAEVKEDARDDLVALGDDIRALDLDVEMPGVDAQAKAEYGQAVEYYGRAQQAFDRAKRPGDLAPVTEALEEGRFHMTAAKALLEGRPAPERRPPCFFDPRHGPSVRDVEWAPAGGQPRAVPACAADATRLEEGLEPMAREITVGGQRTPYWNAPAHYGPYAGGYFGGFGGGLLPGLLVGSMLGGGMGFGGPTVIENNYYDGGDLGGGDFGGGDFGGGDFGGGDFGGGDFGGGDFGGGDFGGGDF